MSGDLIVLTHLNVGDPNCPDGGTEIQVGPPNGSGGLSEVTQTGYACNGAEVFNDGGGVVSGGQNFCPANACVDGVCVNTTTTYLCYCLPGYNGSGTQSCTLSNVCEANVTCQAPYTCEDTVAAGGSLCLGEQASWPMPDDAPGAEVAPRYADNGDGTVDDAVTGLIWQQVPHTGACDAGTPAANGAVCNQAQAAVFCSGLTLGGQNGWRLPTKVELDSLLSTSQEQAPYISPAAFPNVPTNAEYWTISPYEPTGGNGWTFQFSNGTSHYEGSTSYNGNVLCVLGTGMTVNTAPTQYTVHAGALGGNGDTVTDNRTGLVWQRNYGGQMNSADAQAYCAALGSGFRIPTVKELATLVDPTSFDPAVAAQGPFGDQGGALGTPAANFHTSSPQEPLTNATAPLSGNTWSISFQYGHITGYGGDNGSYYVRCVESGTVSNGLPLDGGAAPNFCPAGACANGTCVNGPSSYTCDCLPGYAGTGTQSCTLSNACEANVTCAAPYTCEDTVAAGGSVCLGEQASWPMPDDAPGAKVPPSYSSTSLDGSVDGTVSDGVTGLVWQQTPQTGGCAGTGGGASCNQAQAVAYCSGLTLGGQSGWRLPTKVELESLLDTQQPQPPYISPGAFPNVPTNAEYWTISPYEPTLGNGWTFQFSNGTSHYEGSTSYNGNVLCVLGTGLTVNTAPTQYTINPNAIGGDAAPGDTVTDNRTGLVWQRNYGGQMNSAAAQAYCAALGSGFRIPTVKELATLVDPTSYSPAVAAQGPFGDQGGALGTPAANFHTSSPLEPLTDTVNPLSGNTWSISFQYGHITGYGGDNGSYYVRCVH